MSDVKVTLQSSSEKELQEKLEEMELRVKGILGAIPAGVVFITLDGRIEAITDQFEVLSGYGSRDICNYNISKFIQSDRSDADLAKRLAECCDEGLVSAEGLKKSGEKVPLRLTVSMINTAEGVGLMLCLLDASKQGVL
ncbi:MAG: PAS domain-containing protein [Candidatus Obscuribacterales bacterium]|jgi:PAS domain S-box-containing protein